MANAAVTLLRLQQFTMTKYQHASTPSTENILTSYSTRELV